MRIKKISIKGYRSCESCEFEPNQSLSALIGPNGSGKTNVLSAIKLLSALSYVRNRRFINGDPSSKVSEIKTWYDWNGKTIIHTAQLSLVTNEKNQDEIVESSESWYMYDVIGKKSKINLPLEIFFDLIQERDRLESGKISKREAYIKQHFENIGFGIEAFEAIENVVNFIGRIKYYSASQFTNPSNCPLSFEVEGRRGISITDHKKFLFDLYQQYKTNSDNYNEFLEIVGANGIGLIESLEFKEIETSSSSYSVMTGGKFTKSDKVNLLVVPIFNIAHSRLSPSQLSEGTFKTLALIFYLVTDKSTLLMIEEPEVCVHHGLLISIIELIKTYSFEKQIFISTHSDTVLDNLDIDNIFKIRRGENGTNISSVKKSMSRRDLEALKDYLRNEGSLGEYWKNGDLESE